MIEFNNIWYNPEIDKYITINEFIKLPKHEKIKQFDIAELIKNNIIINNETIDDKHTVIHNNTYYWIEHGKKHRNNDEPCVIDSEGSMYWFKYDVPHRDGDKPAVIKKDGTMMWINNGKFHRLGDKPAVILPDGTKQWYINGIRHRSDNETFTINEITGLFNINECVKKKCIHIKPAVILPDGTEICYYAGYVHNINGPAIVRTKYIDNKLVYLWKFILINTDFDNKEDWNYHCDHLYENEQLMTHKILCDSRLLKINTDI